MWETPVVVLWVLSGLAHGEVQTHVFVNIRMPWMDALEYCRETYHDLSTITSAQENDILQGLMDDYSRSSSWIGLHHYTSLDPALLFPGLSWKWADGDWTDYQNWAPGEPNSGGDCTEMLENGLWNNKGCQSSNTFICSKSQRISEKIVLVTEKMTWEDALLYCRERYTDLASLLTDNKVARADETARAAQAAHVWTSLRFLAGAWLWVSETNQTQQEFTQGSLPSCPVQPYSCGARSPNDRRWENRDCQEKLNFLCYKA